MKSIFYIIPFCLGIMAVLQGSINRLVAKNFGVINTTLISNIITLTFTIFLFFLCSKFKDALPLNFITNQSPKTVPWWVVIPGIFGSLIVLAIPFTIPQIGAANLFLGMIFAQLVTSSLWDYHMEQIPFTLNRGLGILLTFLGVLLAMSPWNRPQ